MFQPGYSKHRVLLYKTVQWRTNMKRELLTSENFHHVKKITCLTCKIISHKQFQHRSVIWIIWKYIKCTCKYFVSFLCFIFTILNQVYGYEFISTAESRILNYQFGGEKCFRNLTIYNHAILSYLKGNTNYKKGMPDQKNGRASLSF